MGDFTQRSRLGADGFEMLMEDTVDPELLEQLPTLPGTAMAFIGMCEDHTVGVRDVATLAQTDPALVAKILHVANSPYYSPREPVSDLARASAILGLRSLKVIGVGFAILGDLWKKNGRSDHLTAYIGASTIAGSGARSFSARIGTGRNEAALTAGLLSFVGELSLLRCFPERTATLWDRCDGPPSPVALQDEFGIDGASLGSILVERWSIPEELRVGVSLRLQPFEQRLTRRPEVFDAAVGFGTAIAELLLAPQPSLVGLKPHVGQWGFSDEDLGEYLAEFSAAVQRTAQQIEPSVAADLDALVTEARDEYLSSEVHAATELVAVHRRIDELEAENDRLEDLSLKDPLTEIPNRAAFDNTLRGAAATALRSTEPPRVAVAMFDLDRFKEVNDTHGHQAGDALLVAVARAAVGVVRTGELFVRLGGDEFAMVLHAVDADALGAAVERIRAAMNAAAAAIGECRGVTVSAGAAMLTNVANDLDDSIRQIVREADGALYAVKRSGRNRTVVAARGAAGA